MRKDVLETSRKMRRQRMLRGLWIFGGVVLFLIFAFAGLARISYFKIKKVAIEGNSTLGSEELMSNVLGAMAGNYFFIFPKSNILLVSSEKIEEKISSDFPRIRQIAVSKNLPDSLSVKIEERKPTALLVNNSGDSYFIDEKGYAFEKSPSFSGNIFIKFSDERENNSLGQKQLISEEQFKGLLALIGTASNKDVKITDVILRKEGIYNLNVQEGLPGQASWQIILSERNNLKVATDNLKIVIESQIKEKRQSLEYVDLRLANKVFYKFK